MATFRVSVRGSLRAEARAFFFQGIWDHLGSAGLIGVHEGSVLAEESWSNGLEKEAFEWQDSQDFSASAWVPLDYDWVGHQDQFVSMLYFSANPSEIAEACAQFQRQMGFPGLEFGAIELQPDQDWDAQWRASFLNHGAGVEISPFWRVVPPWVEPAAAGDHHLVAGPDRCCPQEVPQAPQLAERWIKINPGAGFGTGTHETTQVCLQALGERAILHRPKQAPSLQGLSVLDFGSGSGILAIAAALLQAKQVVGVELDPDARANAVENAKLNKVEAVSWLSALPERQDQADPDLKLELNDALELEQYDIILANILKPVLLSFAQALVARLADSGMLILSGLLEHDVPVIEAAYRQAFAERVASLSLETHQLVQVLNKQHQTNTPLTNTSKLNESLHSLVLQQQEWRAVVFTRRAL